MHLAPSPNRRGAIAPLAALLLVPMMAMLAFAIDLGWITHTHNQLQAAADAAALAGAGTLSRQLAAHHLPGLSDSKRAEIRALAVQQAKAAARNFAGFNPAGDAHNLSLLEADIEVSPTTASSYPNTVKVTLRRDGTANGALPLFFARVLGVNMINLTATAKATLFGTSLDRLTPGMGILPMAYDVNHWDAFVRTGMDPDGKVNVHDEDPGADRLPHLSVYPSIKFKGNFGELSLNQSNNGASEIRDWIKNGVDAADIAALESARLLPLSQHDPNGVPDWKGNPGLKTSTIQEVGEHVGKVYMLPLFKPVDADPETYQAGEGQGSNHYFTIVRFVPVLITFVDATGNDKGVFVRPAVMADPAAAHAPGAPATATTTVIIGARLVD